MVDDRESLGWEIVAVVLREGTTDPSAHLEDARFDSLARVLLIGEVHDRLGIVVEPTTMDSWVTVADLVEYIDSHAAAGG